MLDFQDGLLEENLILKLQNSFMDRFCLEQNRASELALEIMEMFSLSDSNLIALDQYYLG